MPGAACRYTEVTAAIHHRGGFVDTAIALREVLGDQTYGSLAHARESMTNAAMAA
jgi:hypothetical protein